MDEDVQRFWDEQAATFDEEPDHALSDPAIRQAWSDLLRRLMPRPPADVIDLGCGTGSVSVLLAEQGYEVRGLDLSERMVVAATSKAQAAGVAADFQQGDASNPPYAAGSADVVLARHVLWALPDPSGGLASWIRLLRPAGRLVLIEGCWTTGAGLTAEESRRLVREHRAEAIVEHLDDPALWGHATQDERYAVISRA
jgi:ubiquinone/menaquinone biosynthesis C-methylase UbiE